MICEMCDDPALLNVSWPTSAGGQGHNVCESCASVLAENLSHYPEAESGLRILPAQKEVA